MDEKEKESKSFKETINSLDSEQKSTIKSVIIKFSLALILVLIFSVLIYLKFSIMLSPEDITQLKSIYDGIGKWGLVCLVSCVLFYIFGFIVFLHYKKKYKEGETESKIHIYILKMLIYSGSALMVTWGMFTESILYDLYVFFLAFGLCWMFFELFAAIRFETFNKLLSFPLALVFRFIIPMMPILIILLGSIHGMYPSDSTFLSDVASNFGTDTFVDISNGGSLGMIFGYICYKLVSTIYLIGESRPMFMFVLCILSSLILLYLAIYKHFIKGVPPLSFLDNVSDTEAIKSKNIIDKDKTKKDIDEDYAGNPNLLEIL